MELGERLNHQRVKHIVGSYQLQGEDQEAFHRCLEDLLAVYPTPLIELALVETLVDRWLHAPLLRGCEFLTQAHARLKSWQKSDIISTIGPAQFQEITGLDPAPIFGLPDAPTASIQSMI